MGCLKGQSTHAGKKGRFECKKCGAVASKKGKVCKPRKVKTA